MSLTRLRLNNIGDPVGTSNPIVLSSNSTTTPTWTSAPGFATIVAPNYYVVIVNPGTTFEEIIYLTAFTAAATSGTVLRAQEGTSGLAATGGAPWIHGPTAYDYLAAADQLQGSTYPSGPIVSASGFMMGLR
jgi:hypothetical protein